MGAKKNFVIDTNVILHDYKCLKNFQENDIYLPIVVLEELDKFKKGNEQINYNAREFVRELDLITDELDHPIEGIGKSVGIAVLDGLLDSGPELLPGRLVVVGHTLLLSKSFIMGFGLCLWLGFCARVSWQVS